MFPESDTHDGGVERRVSDRIDAKASGELDAMASFSRK